jgi:hypothetical protein
MKYHYLEIPRLGSIYAERSVHAKWLKYDHELHPGEVEILWGRWRFILTSWCRLKEEREVNHEPDFGELFECLGGDAEAIHRDTCCPHLDPCNDRYEQGAGDLCRHRKEAQAI